MFIRSVMFKSWNCNGFESELTSFLLCVHTFAVFMSTELIPILVI